MLETMIEEAERCIEMLKEKKEDEKDLSDRVAKMQEQLLEGLKRLQLR